LTRRQIVQWHLGGPGTAFLVGGTWTSQMPLVRAASDEQLVRRSIWVERWPSKVLISAGGALTSRAMRSALGIRSVYAVVAGKKVRIFEVGADWDLNFPVNSSVEHQVWIAHNDFVAPEALVLPVPPQPATLCGERWHQPPWRRHEEGNATGEWIPSYPVYFVLEAQTAPTADKDVSTDLRKSDGIIDATVSFRVGGAWADEETLRGQRDASGYAVMRSAEHLKDWPTRLRLAGLPVWQGWSGLSLILGPQRVDLPLGFGGEGGVTRLVDGTLEIEVPQREEPRVARRADGAASGTWHA